MRPGHERAAAPSAALTEAQHRNHSSLAWAEAQANARRGWREFPVNGKVPLVPDWPNVASCDPEVLAGWERQYPLANHGIATGAPSGLIVLDVDPRHGGEESLAELERRHGAMPTSPVMLTGGGGMHFYFGHPGGTVGNRAGIAPGLDIRGDGGFVVGAGSLHASGRRYTWDVEHHPDDVPLAPAPAWLLACCTPAVTKAATPTSEWRELVAGVAEGRRNDTVLRLAGHLLRRRVDPLVALELLRAWNSGRCSPPLPEHEVDQAVASAARRELRRRCGAA